MRVNRTTHARADEAFAAYVSAKVNDLYRTAYLLMGNRHDAEDLAQLALARALVAWRKHGRLENPDGYVYRIMINARAARWRRLDVRQEVLGGWVPDGVAPNHEGQSDQADELMRALAALPRTQRTAVVLRYYVDMSLEETAKAMGCSVGTVKSYASRGLARLRAALDEALDPTHGGRR